MHVLVTCKYEKRNREKVDTIFPIISQWGLSVDMDTRVLIQSASTHKAAIFMATPSDATHKIGSGLANWPERYSSSNKIFVIQGQVAPE